MPPRTNEPEHISGMTDLHFNALTVWIADHIWPEEKNSPSQYHVKHMNALRKRLELWPFWRKIMERDHAQRQTR